MINLARPDVIYSLLWGVVILVTYLFPTNLTSPFNNKVTLLILLSIFSFFFSYFFWWFIFRTQSYSKECFSNDLEVFILRKFVKILFKVWILFLLINTIFSGGLPLYWLLVGDPRTYADFGVPSFSGFSNMFRLFLCSSFAILFIKTKLKRYLFLLLIMYFSCILEMSRGGVVVSLLYSIGVLTLLFKFTPHYFLTRLSVVLIFLIIFIIGFGYLGELRGTGILIENMVPESSIFNHLPPGFFWVFTYLTSPYNNLNYAANFGIEPLLTGEFTFLSLLPSVIRDYLFSKNDIEYPIRLATDAFNATSYFAPILADFGFVATSFVVFILQLITCYVYFRARKGSYFYFILYPSLFMCLVMSVFYSYYFSLIVVMYPFIAFVFVNYRKSYFQRIQSQ